MMGRIPGRGGGAMRRSYYSRYEYDDDTLDFGSFRGTGKMEELTKESGEKSVGPKVWKFAQNNPQKIRVIGGVLTLPLPDPKLM